MTPGLIDLHAHVYPYGSAIGIPADELAQFQCATTLVSAGDAGVNNIAALRRYIVAQSRARIYAFIHIANNGLSGFPVAELHNIDHAQVEACATPRGHRSRRCLTAAPGITFKGESADCPQTSPRVLRSINVRSRARGHHVR